MHHHQKVGLNLPPRPPSSGSHTNHFIYNENVHSGGGNHGLLGVNPNQKITLDSNIDLNILGQDKGKVVVEPRSWVDDWK